MGLDDIVRRHIYDVTLATGSPPSIAALTNATEHNADDVRAALQRLAAGRMVVRQADSGEILMAPPFSAVPTPFAVTIDDRDRSSTPFHCYANCAWDALGVPVMVRTAARVHTACGCCGEAISLEVDPDRAPEGSEIVHFAVPAARWWQDIVFT